MKLPLQAFNAACKLFSCVLRIVHHCQYGVGKAREYSTTYRAENEKTVNQPEGDELLLEGNFRKFAQG
jgi:hypothetical protein